MTATKLDSMELEAMRKEDSSWHPCRISLSSGDPNTGIVVDFGTDEEEDVICNTEDALSRLRFRSTPLQGDECTNIKEGERVLALQKTKSKSLFIDATIEEPRRVKHSKRVHCRCTFQIKWLNSELKGETVTVPSKSILKLSDRSIDEHQVFSRFLNVLKSENGGETPSVISFSEESSCEAEFIGILEKQVEEISKLVDGTKASFSDLFEEVKSGTANVVKQKSKIRQVASQRTTRSQNKNLLETEVKEETEVKKETEVRPVLTPLAARAALASLVHHELPEKSLGFSGEQDFLKHKDSQQSDATGTTEHSTIEATSNSVKSTFYVQNEVLRDPNPSKRTNKNSNIEVKNAFIASPNRLQTEGKRKSHDSSDMSATLEKETKPSREFYGGIEDEPIILQHSTNSLNGEETKCSTNARRITRSMQKEFEVSSLHMKQGSPIEMPRNTQKPTRSAHSAAPEEISVPNEVDKAPISKSPTLEPQNILPANDDVEGENLTKKFSGAINRAGCTKSTKQRKKSNSNHDMTPESNAPTAYTGHKAEEIATPENNEIKKKRFISNHMDSTSETDSTADRNEPLTKRRTRSSCEDELGTTMKVEESIPAMKKSRVSSQKDSTIPLRSSPRLACPPRARSQARS
ncbi:hypothetical protein KFK09_021532 [Dendrobium nobile]|uniref:SAWADEE domain-containing protein n=1 Tax=Dendrobium nobile TaxID=94219 RepID=A0A8T3AQC5_DENNO|nr:hypothetical protein KFK09_021532 [Dendrobium nobile]